MLLDLLVFDTGALPRCPLTVTARISMDPLQTLVPKSLPNGRKPPERNCGFIQ